LVARAFVDKGYNTNYAAGWHFVRSVPRYTFDATTSPASILAGGTPGKSGLKGLSTTLGPLKMRVLETGPVASSNVALLGDGAPGDIDEAVLAASIKYGPFLSDGATPDPFANNSTDKRTFIEAGEMLAEAFNDGPAYYDPSSKTLNLIDQAANLTQQVDCEVAGSCPPPVTGNNSYLQDTRDWYAVHGGGKTATCNILFADGSVKEFTDMNNDKFLNPGFPVPNNLTEAEYAVIGYRDSTVELPPGQVFNGMFLMNLQKRSAFE
jgi:prepilin-type processing-associated H-X9-DG protein